MVANKYQEECEKVNMEVHQAVAVSLTADIWTFVNMKAYLALTCHYINDSLQLCSWVLIVQYLPHCKQFGPGQKRYDGGLGHNRQSKVFIFRPFPSVYDFLI